MNIKILLIENNALNTELFQVYLKKYDLKSLKHSESGDLDLKPYKIVIISVEKISSTINYLDLIIYLKGIRKKNDSVKILALVTDVDFNLRMAKEIGFDNFLLKPVSGLAMTQMVDFLISQT